MGIPSLFRWLSNKYPKIISTVIEELPQEVDGEVIPVNTIGPNPNGEEVDNLYLDMNGIVHLCTHPDGRPPAANEQEMMLEIFQYTNRVVNIVRPRKLLMIAIDGVAPRAKMNQQRARRFRSAQEAKENDNKKEELQELLVKRQAKKGEDEDTWEKVVQKTWDSNAITPGTPFMDILSTSLRYWVAYKLNSDPAWEKMKVIISDATVPGEGEHKIMEFVRSQRASPEHDPNTRHVIYGLDADLIMLGLATHEPHFRILREDVYFQESRPHTCKLCGRPGHKAEECTGNNQEISVPFGENRLASPLKPFIWFHVSVLREYLAAELYVPQQPFLFDLERALDDWIFMCFFVGNDFLPRLPSLDVRENGIDTLIEIWRENIPRMDGYLTEDGHVAFKRAQLVLQGLAKQEDAIFRRRRQVEERRAANEKRRKEQEKARNAERASKRRSSPPRFDNKRARTGSSGVDNAPPTGLDLITPDRGNLSKETRELTHDMVTNRCDVYRAHVEKNSVAAALKTILMKSNRHGLAASLSPVSTGNEEASADISEKTDPSDTGKRNAGEVPKQEKRVFRGKDSSLPPYDGSEDDGIPKDTVRLWEPGYADRYYEQKFKVDTLDYGFRHKVGRAYVEGLAWVLLYYFQGCASWDWYYPYHYAPFAADFVDIEEREITFEKGKPIRPFEQLMSVLPASSNHALPETFHPLMSDPKSDIIDFYPEDFDVDLNGRRFASQGVILLPFIDGNRLLAAMEKKYPLLTENERIRNTHGKEVILLLDRHPLYRDLVRNLYSKEPGTPSYKLNVRVSEGLAGSVERIETYILHSSLVSPLVGYDMPGLDYDHSLTVNYRIPESSQVHKCMLLRGVKFASPILNVADVRAVQGRAERSGRPPGGIPLRGRGRGGWVNYNSGVDRPNRFAARIKSLYSGAALDGVPTMPPNQGGGECSSRGSSGPRRGNGIYGYNQGNTRRGGSYGQQGQHNQSQYRGNRGVYNDNLG
ncbi:5'-3' exoribonuclease 2 [Penicillium cf. viridicatum]|uniref:5'-3' exoribonuclease n=1 Tax=Penicillium cf. viridicatum TaxID=2972119 RepID=A0A9W9LZC0_9EURO|nr:5'-3' exoribonuclease 2 [Penicillium cf. viridicatum]